MTVLIRLLGGLAVEVDGAPIDLPAATQRRALIYLTIHANEVVGVDRLADAVWNGESPKQLEHAVHSLVYRLRRHLSVEPSAGSPGAHVDRVRPGYSLVIDPTDVDANRFTATTRQALEILPRDPSATRTMLTEALELWRGDALLDVAYDDWAAAEIRRLTETRLCACEALADANIVLGEPELAIAELESLTERFPLRESLWVLLWKAMAAAGRHLDVTASHRRAVKLLSSQFQIQPSPHLAELALRYGSAPTEGRPALRG
ncbi:AfsR/SARP family transcriptional regulator [Ilumatobacter sp.]|uniref:AfsR/SARP family transcriptional regulator n=1 Tax=Ilumatobacter sp. TaxID=1967498 RepID=UPI003AF4A4F8